MRLKFTKQTRAVLRMLAQVFRDDVAIHEKRMKEAAAREDFGNALLSKDKARIGKNLAEHFDKAAIEGRFK